MDIGLQQLGKSLLATNSHLAVISNNIANSATDRFKSDTLSIRSFSDYFIHEDHISNKENLYEITTHTDFTSGEIYKRNSNDFALDGNGFIAVIYNDNLCYSRGGSFNVDADGYLVDQHGSYILGTQGNILVNNANVEISKDGTVTLDGIYADTIEISDFEDYRLVNKTGKDYYVAEQGANVLQSNTNLLQGYSEKSNVSITSEYLRMIEMSKKFETGQAVIQILDEINGKAVNNIAIF